MRVGLRSSTEYASQLRRHAMLTAMDPSDTADPGTPSRRDLHDRTIWGTRDNVNAYNAGVTSHNGPAAAATTTTRNTAATRGTIVRASDVMVTTTRPLMIPVATVLTTNDGEPVRMPYPNHAALELVISIHIARLTPRE
jgi:hypothetical protein